MHMGDISAEPSMEDILSSIKRIIAEEGDATHTRQRRPQRAAPPAPEPAAIEAQDDHVDEVLELSDPMPAAPRSPEPRSASEPRHPPEPTNDEPILSQETAAASRGALETLSKLLVKPEPGADGTLEGLVREMLRPMLREWLDANLPELVETLVAREIEKIVGQAR